MQWPDFWGKLWRAFMAGFLGGALAAVTPMLDAVSKGGDMSGDWSKALVVGFMFGGLTAGFRAVYALLPVDEADNTVGAKKGETQRIAAEAANEVANLVKEFKHGMSSMDKSAQAAQNAARATRDTAKQIGDAVKAMDSTAELARNAAAMLQEHTAATSASPPEKRSASPDPPSSDPTLRTG
jgi:methyl-accepting chemotaxis protein